MFTGLIEEVGVIADIEQPAERPESGRKIEIQCSKILNDLQIGDSIAVNGVCLTAESVSPNGFTAFMIPETLKAVNLGLRNPGDRVNLERAMPANGRFGGHIVQGHVEGMAVVRKIKQHEKHMDVFLNYQSKAIVPKGSVALDGISLTVQAVDENGFSVQIIPETIRQTNIGDWKEGDKINIETDYLLKAFLFQKESGS